MKYCIMPVTQFNQNCSLIWCEKTNIAMLIDPGGDELFLLKKINHLKIKIKKIVITHGHLDHVGAAKKIADYYTIPIIGPNINDEIILKNLPHQCTMFGLQPISPILPNQWLQEGDIITCGKEEFKIMHCPGHSPGHIILINKKNKFIIMGDILFNRSIGRYDLPGGDKNKLIDSLKNKILTIGDRYIFLPGHGKMSNIGYEKLHNPYIINLF